MLAVIAALGWTLAFAGFLAAARWYRSAREWRVMAEALMQQHRPDDFSRYTRRLAERGEEPLLSKYSKEP